MNINDFAKELVARNSFIKASFGGFAGSGKSRTGTDFVIGAYKELKCKKPVLIIDNEKGSRFLIPIFKKAGVPALLKETSSLSDVLAAMEYLEQGQVDFMFVDSLTKVYYNFVRDYKIKNKIKRMQLNDWGVIVPEWQERFSDRFVELNGNFMFTGRGGFEYEKEDDETDDETGKVTKKGALVKSGVKMKLAGETPFEPDLNVWMQVVQSSTVKKGKRGLEVYREAHILKDRSGLIDGRTYKNPTYKDFSPMVKFLVGNPIGEVVGVTNSDGGAPVENHEYYRRKMARDIEVEKIKSLFDRLALGTSGADKRLRSLILDKVIGTTSGTELEKMDPDVLYAKREDLMKVVAKLEVHMKEREHWADLFVECGSAWMAEPTPEDFIFSKAPESGSVVNA